MQKIKFIVFEQVSKLKNNRVNQFSKGTLINDDLIDILMKSFLSFITPNDPLTPCKKLSSLYLNKYAYSKNNRVN